MKDTTAGKFNFTKMFSHTDTTELFFALVRCGIGKEKTLPGTPTPSQWHELFETAKRQTLAGIAFAGIERLPSEQRPPKEIILQWYTLCESIKNRNIDLNNKAAIVSRKFKTEGFSNCILKGQGIAQLYPNPLLRTPGDIDIWLDGGDKKVIAYVKEIFPDCAPTYHHVDFPVSAEVEIEIHYRPSWMCNPCTDRKIQRFYSAQAAELFNRNDSEELDTFPIPDIAFNRIFILHHIYRHLFSEGIGIRQVLDYYFVMQQEMTEEERKAYIGQLKEFGLHKFASAVTYVMQRMFALDKEHTIVEPNRKEGEFLLREMMLAGNFGMYDTRYTTAAHGINMGHMSNIAKRSFRLFAHYPAETFWTPIFKIWHWFWRKKNGHK